MFSTTFYNIFIIRMVFLKEDNLVIFYYFNAFAIWQIKWVAFGWSGFTSCEFDSLCGEVHLKVSPLLSAIFHSL
jgi:hypothetical protein